MAQRSRIEAARRKARAVRYAAGAGAGIAFVAVALLARASHPGTTHATSGNSGAATAVPATSDDSFFSGGAGGSFSAPQSSVPQVQSGGS